MTTLILIILFVICMYLAATTKSASANIVLSVLSAVVGLVAVIWSAWG